MKIRQRKECLKIARQKLESEPTKFKFEFNSTTEILGFDMKNSEEFNYQL